MEGEIMKFAMGRAWSDALELIRFNASRLAAIAAGLVVLPMLAAYALMPEFFSIVAAAGNPEAMAMMMQSVMPRLMAISLLANLVQMVAYAAMIEVMAPGRPGVAEAIRQGLRSLFSLIAAGVIFMAGFILFMLALMIVVGIVVAVLAMIAVALGAQGQAAAGVLMLLLILPVYIGVFVCEFYAIARFMLTLPIIVIEREYNPFDALRRSWTLTKSSAWPLLGFLPLLGIAVTVIYLVVLFGILGASVGNGALLEGPPPVGTIVTLAAIFSVMGLLISMLTSAVLVATYRQLAAEPPSDEVAQTA